MLYWDQCTKTNKWFSSSLMVPSLPFLMLQSYPHFWFYPYILLIIWSRINYTQNNTDKPSPNRNLSALNTGLIIFLKCINCIVGLFNLFKPMWCTKWLNRGRQGEVTCCLLCNGKGEKLVLVTVRVGNTVRVGHTIRAS